MQGSYFWRWASCVHIYPVHMNWASIAAFCFSSPCVILEDKAVLLKTYEYPAINETLHIRNMDYSDDTKKLMEDKPMHWMVIHIFKSCICKIGRKFHGNRLLCLEFLWYTILFQVMPLFQPIRDVYYYRKYLFK